MDSAWFLLRSTLLRTPTLILFVVGVLIALVRFKRHPKVSALALAGLCLWQLETFTFILVRKNLLDWIRGHEWTPSTVYIALNVTQDFFYSAMLALLVAAAFTQRGNRLTANN
ncbi:MAG TPA: hypothetical protein VFA21_18310 [Pyrinomonadaceae bacterium]|jgi:uncharacterized membrane protein YpjA|nr:hypothetical protein [Pyrinomonadaceae bacterium]